MRGGPLDQEAVGLKGTRAVAVGPDPRSSRRRLGVAVDDGLHRTDDQRRREESQVAEVIVRTVARAAAVVRKGNMEVARAFRAAALARVFMRAAGVRAVVWAGRVMIRAVVGVIVDVMAIVVATATQPAVIVVVAATRERMSVRLRVHMQPTARVERDADRMPRRHADNHLRKQEERKHEAKQGCAHGVRPDLQCIAPFVRQVKRMPFQRPEFKGPDTIAACSPATLTSAERPFAW